MALKGLDPQVAASLAGAGASAAGSLINAGINYGIQKDLAKDNYNYNEMAADNADKRTRALYEDYYSVQAQKKQLLEAGLSPSLAYGAGGGGSAGQAQPKGAQGNGASGLGGLPMDTSGINNAAQIVAQMHLINSEAKLNDAKRLGQEIANADDPVIQRYISEKQQAIQDANNKESDQINSAYQTLINGLVNIGYESSSFTLSKSHGEGESESEGSGWSFGFTDEYGKAHNWNAGANVSIGLTNGGGANFGYGESSHKGSGKNASQNTSTSWARNVSDAITKGGSHSGNKTAVFELLKHFSEQCEEAQHYGYQNRQNARDTYQYRVDRYERNRKEQGK